MAGQPVEAAPPQRPWAILASVPAVVDTLFLGKGRDMSVDVKVPPLVSVVKVASRLIPNNPVVRYPYITAADPSGCLLLCASDLSERWHHMIPGDNERAQILDMDKKRHAYFLCDTATLRAFRLPGRKDDDGPILHSGNVGLIRGHDDRLMVAELQPSMARAGEATLLCHLAGTDGWVKKQLTCYPEYVPKEGWGNNGVVSSDGYLWWIDLSFGLLSCDPFDEQPDLLSVPLPQGCVVPFENRVPFPDAIVDLDKTRCVQASDGSLRYVQIDDGTGGAGASTIRMWTLTFGDADADADGVEWAPRYAVSFGTLWEGESYRRSGLPCELPAVALVHPWDPDVVFFWLDKTLFAMRVPAAEVLSCDRFENLAPNLPALVRDFPSSRLVQPWKLFPDHHGSRTDNAQASSASSAMVVD